MSRNREAAIQAEIVAMIRAELEGAVAYAVLNDGLFSKSEAAKRKWMGLLPGCPDVGGVTPCGQPFFLEVKAPGGKTSPEQNETIERLRRTGALVAVVRSKEEARAAFTAWGIAMAEREPA